jgi:hypothetical protein
LIPLLLWQIAGCCGFLHQGFLRIATTGQPTA